MRTAADIEHAVWQLRDAVRGGLALPADPGDMRAMIAMLSALRWVQGDVARGGFGDMLAALDAVDTAGAVN